MSKLKELEKRLRDEPENLGLRVAVAGAMREAGRHGEAVELYRSVAVAYRAQGRAQQAIAVCRSILDIAPADLRCRELLAELAPPGSGEVVIEAGTPTPPPRPSSMEETPLPRALPYHVADPTTQSLKKLSDVDLSADLPVSEGADTRPGSDGVDRPTVTGLSNAARRISASLIADHDLSLELETRQRPRLSSREMEIISKPPPTVPFERIDDADDDVETTPPAADHDTDEEEHTKPRDVGFGRVRTPTKGPLASPFFAPLPIDQRNLVLLRFHRRSVAAGTTLIRQGETGHAFVLVAKGRLDVRAERANGTLVQVGTIAIGEFVGEAALLARTPAAAHVVAATEAEVMLLPPRDFYEIAGAFPALWAELKDVAERRTREHEQRLRGSTR